MRISNTIIFIIGKNKNKLQVYFQNLAEKGSFRGSDEFCDTSGGRFSGAIGKYKQIQGLRKFILDKASPES